jgi:hypothetical protein
MQTHPLAGLENRVSDNPVSIKEGANRTPYMILIVFVMSLYSIWRGLSKKMGIRREIVG